MENVLNVLIKVNQPSQHCVVSVVPDSLGYVHTIDEYIRAYQKILLSDYLHQIVSSSRILVE